ncbi:restriction endonuclease [Ruegeria faecimaris]|uniref:restriction endonuclease n=1 Tax=Ruegeria faecimaris TaxID=686389 RepID=UPI002491D053|nr:restriction endonuclease [Ruegeria faecimaris]
MTKIVPFSQLGTTDLVVDAVYEGGNSGTAADDPISKLLPGSGNQGGFRAAGRGEQKKFVVLYTSGEDKDWPDHLNLSTGQFVYHGDNKTPGHELHDTRRGGNRILRSAFDNLHSVPPSRDNIPPFFVFEKYPTEKSSRSVRFRGLAVPGFTGLAATSDLVAVWKSSDGQRFQNYQASFTILDVPVVQRGWLIDLGKDSGSSKNSPHSWLEWIRTGRCKALTAESTTDIREPAEQFPTSPAKISILRAVWTHFKDNPVAFEAFAARIFQMHDQRVIIDNITRASVDGGRDAVGRYLLGLDDDPVYAEFSLEAKCYQPPFEGAKPTTVGVADVARLISRLKHRQFGALVTTSVIGRQAYKEVREDRHPIIFLCGKDIADILSSNGFNTAQLVETFLKNEFEISGSKT